MDTPRIDIGRMQAETITADGEKDVLHIIYDNSMNRTILYPGYRLELWKEGKRYELVPKE